MYLQRTVQFIGVLLISGRVQGMISGRMFEFARFSSGKNSRCLQSYIQVKAECQEMPFLLAKGEFPVCFSSIPQQSVTTPQNPDGCPEVTESAVQHIPYTFNIIGTLNKCQQAEILFSTFLQGLNRFYQLYIFYSHFFRVFYQVFIFYSHFSCQTFRQS